MFFIIPRPKKISIVILLLLVIVLILKGLNLKLPPASGLSYDQDVAANAEKMLPEGKNIFRFDTFGNEDFWGNTLKLHQAVQGAALGGIGPGLSPEKALSVGLKVDSEALPSTLIKKIKKGQVDLDNPSTTVELLRLNAIVGVTGFFDSKGKLTSLGIQCALCHSMVDDAIAPGIGHRLDGWANRDLNVGAIIALAPNLEPFVNLLGVSEETVRKVLLSWGPGKFDAQLVLDGKAFRPDGKSAATLIPPAFGLAGVNLHTWTGFGSVPYWNAFVAVLEMHGKGRFLDERLKDPAQFPIAAREGLWNVKNTPDLISPKLPALHFYQMSLPAPKPPKDSFNQAAALRGKQIFSGKGRCSTCHVPPTFTEPGFNMHKPEEIGIDSFQADRSPEKRYRTSPLAGLWTHQKGGFYHDGRFRNLLEVVEHYERVFGLNLGNQEKNDLVEYLKSI